VIRFISFTVLVTLSGLFYIHTEVAAVQVGYEIRKLEDIKMQALDRSRALKYNIASHKSPHNLERRLAAQRILLESPKQWQTLVISNRSSGQKPALTAQSFANQPPSFMRFLVGTAQAEAKESSNR
jgi:hypothetical protein